MRLSTFLLALVSLVYLVNASNIYRRADEASSMIDDTSAEIQQKKSGLMDNIAKLVGDFLGGGGEGSTSDKLKDTLKDLPKDKPKVAVSPNKLEDKHSCVDLSKLSHHERTEFHNQLLKLQHEIKQLNIFNNKIVEDSEKLSIQFKQYERYVGFFNESLVFIENFGKGGEVKHGH